MFISHCRHTHTAKYLLIPMERSQPGHRLSIIHFVHSYTKSNVVLCILQPHADGSKTSPVISSALPEGPVILVNPFMLPNSPLFHLTIRLFTFAPFQEKNLSIGVIAGMYFWEIKPYEHPPQKKKKIFFFQVYFFIYFFAADELDFTSVLASLIEPSKLNDSPLLTDGLWGLLKVGVMASQMPQAVDFDVLLPRCM